MESQTVKGVDREAVQSPSLKVFKTRLGEAE